MLLYQKAQWSQSVYISLSPLFFIGCHKDFVDLLKSFLADPIFAEIRLFTKIILLWLCKRECLAADILFCLCTFDWQTSERISHVAAVKINNVISKLDLFITGLIHFSLKKGRANQLIQLYEQNITLCCLFWSRRQRGELYISLCGCKAEVQDRLGNLHALDPL